MEDLFEPLEWTHILATLDVCTNEITQTQFCDEEGNAIIPLCTLTVCYNDNTCPLKDQPSTEADNIPLNHVRNEEISVWDRDSGDDKSLIQTYDALLESIKVETPRNLTIQEIWPRTKSRIILQKERKPRKQNKAQLSSKQEYLKTIKAKDCIKDKIIGLYLICLIKQQSKTKQEFSKKRTEIWNKELSSQENQKETWTTNDSSEEEHKDRISVPRDTQWRTRKFSFSNHKEK